VVVVARVGELEEEEFQIFNLIAFVLISFAKKRLRKNQSVETNNENPKTTKREKRDLSFNKKITRKKEVFSVVVFFHSSAAEELSFPCNRFYQKIRGAPQKRE